MSFIEELRRNLKAGLLDTYRYLTGKGPLFTVLKKFWIPGFYRRLHFAGPFTVQIDPGHAFRMRHYNQYGIETEIFWRGLNNAWESVSISLWKQLLRPDAVIMDVGANQGLYALISKCLCPRARVVAFEPLPSAFKALQANVALNDFEIECLPVAVDEVDGEAEFYSPVDQLATEGSLIAAVSDQARLETKRVTTATLASIIDSHHIQRLDLMKIDVEGTEARVLRGVGRYLRQCRPAILVEVLRNDIGAQIQELVHELDYVYFDINDDPRNGPLGHRQVDRINQATCLNYLLLPREHELCPSFIAERTFAPRP